MVCCLAPWAVAGLAYLLARCSAYVEPVFAWERRPSSVVSHQTRAAAWLFVKFATTQQAKDWRVDLDTRHFVHQRVYCRSLAVYSLDHHWADREGIASWAGVVLRSRCLALMLDAATMRAVAEVCSLDLSIQYLLLQEAAGLVEEADSVKAALVDRSHHLAVQMVSVDRILPDPCRQRLVW